MAISSPSSSKEVLRTIEKDFKMFMNAINFNTLEIWEKNKIQAREVTYSKGITGFQCNAGNLLN